MPDFIDYNEFADANADEEQRQLEEAYQRAQQADATARDALNRSAQQSAPRYGRDGQLGDAGDLSKAASYTDYLKAADDAKKAWAGMVGGDGADPRRSALRDSLNQRNGTQGRADAAMSGLANTESQINTRLGQQNASIARQRESARAAAEAKRLADEQRAEADKKSRETYAQQMAEKAKARAAAGGAQLDFVGGYNPYADSLWAQQQGAFEAQQIANAGGTQAQQQDAWNAYTRKGRFGAGPNVEQTRLRTMAPYAPKPEEEG